MKKKYVACALLVKNNKLLIQERKGISKYGEEWSFFGGGIELGEDSKEALIREIKEELDFNIKEWDIKYFGKIIYYLKDHDLEYHRFVYGIKIPKDINVFNDKEGSGAHFFDFDKLNELKFNTDINFEIDLLKNNY